MRDWILDGHSERVGGMGCKMSKGEEIFGSIGVHVERCDSNIVTAGVRFGER